MANKNICKFISETLAERLSISSFILESNKDIMGNQNKLNENRVILVKKGSGKMYIDNEELDFDAGNLIFAFCDENFYIKANDTCEYMYISFSGLRAEFLFDRFSVSKTNRIFYDFDSLIPFWQDSLLRASDVNIDLISESVLLYTFSRIINEKSEKNTLVNNIIEFTEDNFQNPSLSLNEMAKALSYNAKYISHFFKENMGMGYSEYLRTMRIKYAVTLIDLGLDSIKNVALLSGFNDPLYFSTVFKKQLGITPKEYKLRAASSDNKK